MADNRLPLTAHLAELRRRLVVCVIALVAGLVTSFVFRDRIFGVLTHAGGDPQLYVYTLTGAIGPAMKVSMLGAVIVGLPVFVHQLVAFLSPALTARERRFLYLLTPAVFLSFAAGVAFAYFVLVPPIVEFLLTFGSEVAALQPSLGSYIDTVTALLFWMGVAFETPWLMYFVTVMGIGTPAFFSRHRRTWLLISVLLGAVITPTFDPVNQTMVAAPFVALYEVGILLSRLAARGRRRRTSASPP